ncbi:MAG TPA: error-prone DNA polymerase [Clostridia bacterium]|nr:error-prone DNA polymerase [Clostridia bacterium]
MFVELHARSAFSFLEGASLPEELVEVCAESGVGAMALLDRDGVYGSARFHTAAKKLGLKAHIGSELSLDGESRLPLLVSERSGYQNLCRLITQMKLRVRKNTECFTCPEEIANYSAGLICLTGGDDGPLARALEHGGIDKARRTVEQLTRIFGRENVYVELQRHYDRSEEARNQASLEIARSLGLHVIATNAPQYARAAQRQVLDVFTCIRNHRTLATGRLLSKNSERHIKSAVEMARLFADIPEALANTVELSNRLGFTLADLGYEFPRYLVPDGDTMMSFLRKRTEEGARERYGHPAKAHLRQRARRQIERELCLIEKLKLEGYFLIVWDLVRFCREQGILAQGRGSAANSAVCYSLGITAVDPVGMELLFERFLSEERGEWPDIDLDLPSGDERERVIQYVYQRYGKLGAAMTANVITYRGRSAAREVGKALNFDADTLDRVSHLVGTWEYKDPDDTMERQFRQAGCDLRHPRIQKYLSLCMAVQDLPRHLGQHSGGMVICQGQLDSVVPLEPASMPGRVVVQWDKEDCADMGIIKVDLLGLGMMAVLKDSVSLIERHYGEQVSLAHLPPDDAGVYAALQKADTVGMFQIESRAQMSCLPRLRPQNFYDIVIQVALIRPGPIVGEMVNPYIKRRQGRTSVEYAHPSLEPILERTLGVPLFQEQLLRIAMVAANFTGGEAEELRRALGAKRSEKRMKEIEVKLRRGMTSNGIVPIAQEQIIQSIVSFALYGFPESHAASFALIAYSSAYLKTHYLAAFTAAMLNNQPMGFYSPATIVKDAQRHGLLIKPIDICTSHWLCTLETEDESRRTSRGGESGKPVVRMGLRYVRGLREDAALTLLRERARRPFESIADLARRVPELRKNELVALADIGALNSLGDVTQQALPGVEQPINVRVPGAPARNSAHATVQFHRRDALWQAEAASQPVGPLLSKLAQPDGSSPLNRMTNDERLVADFRGTGLTVGPHPMSYHRARMTKMGAVPAAELANIPNARSVRVAGTVIVRQRPGTAHGFVFLSLEDETGIANIIITPGLFEANRLLLVEERLLFIEGILQNLDGVVSVKADRVLPMRVSAAEIASHDFH